MKKKKHTAGQANLRKISDRAPDITPKTHILHLHLPFFKNTCSANQTKDKLTKYVASPLHSLAKRQEMANRDIDISEPTLIVPTYPQSTDHKPLIKVRWQSR